MQLMYHHGPIIVLCKGQYLEYCCPCKRSHSFCSYLLTFLVASTSAWPLSQRWSISLVAFLRHEHQAQMSVLLTSFFKSLRCCTELNWFDQFEIYYEIQSFESVGAHCVTTITTPPEPEKQHRIDLSLSCWFSLTFGIDLEIAVLPLGEGNEL